jgi:predicted PurR-regulated permease PerM
MSSSKKIQSKKRTLVTMLYITTSLLLLTAFLSMVAPLSSVNAIAQNLNENVKGANFGVGGKPIMNKGFFTNGLANNNNNNNTPQINGTINLKNSTGNASIKNSTISFLSAAKSVQRFIPNGTIIGGHIGVTNGFLTYNFVVLYSNTKNTISN